MDIIEKAKNYVLDKMANIPMSEATITDVDLKGFGLYGLTLLAKVSVSSHYSIPIPIGEIAFVVKSARRGIASGTIPDPRSLKANDLGGHGSFSNNQTLNNVVGHLLHYYYNFFSMNVSIHFHLYTVMIF